MQFAALYDAVKSTFQEGRGEPRTSQAAQMTSKVLFRSGKPSTGLPVVSALLTPSLQSVPEQAAEKEYSLDSESS